MVSSEYPTRCQWSGGGNGSGSGGGGGGSSSSSGCKGEIEVVVEVTWCYVVKRSSNCPNFLRGLAVRMSNVDEVR